MLAQDESSDNMNERKQAGPCMGASDNSYCYLAQIGAQPDLLQLQDMVRSLAGEEGNTYLDPDTFHITLVYATGEAPADFPLPYSRLAFSVLVDGLSFFDTPDGYAVHATVRPSVELLTVQRGLADLTGMVLALSPYSHPDNYRPHITLAYLRAPVEPFSIAPFALTIDQIVLSGPDETPLAMYELKGLPEKYAHIHFKPTPAMQAEARKAGDLPMAKRIASGEALPPDQWRRALAFFTRHEKYLLTGKHLDIWRGWGGDAGWVRAKVICRQMAAADRKKDWGANVDMEYKLAPVMAQEVNDRTVIGYPAVMGNVDDGGDCIQPGAFRKTLAENGGRIRHLWQHKLDEPPIAVIKDIREVGRSDLPEDMLQQYPAIKGALRVTREYLDTPRGNEVLAGIKAGAITEMSIGYSPTRGGADYVNQSGMSVRHLREVKLYECSDVNLGMNSATRAKKSLDDLLTKAYDQDEIGAALGEIELLLDLMLVGHRLSGDDLSTARRVIQMLTDVLPASEDDSATPDPAPEGDMPMQEDAGSVPTEQKETVSADELLLKLAIRERELR